MARPTCDFLGLTRDWIDVRLPMQWDQARAWFTEAVGAEVEDFTAPGRSGYRGAMRAVQPINAGSVSILGDHPKSLGWSMFSATGAAAEWGWNHAVSSFEVAQANRIDAALDFRCSERAFDAMLKEGEALCRLYDRRPFPMGTREEGRSLYFNFAGKKESERTGNEKQGQYTATLYEKGKQMDADPLWRRFELHVRPDKAVQKERLLTLEPDEILGSVEWSRAFLAYIGYNEAVKPARSSPYAKQAPVSEAARRAKVKMSLAYMGEQYGNAFREAVALYGEAEAWEQVRMAFRPVVCLDDGREISGPGLLRREAQQEWSDVFRDDLQRRQYEAGAGGLLH